MGLILLLRGANFEQEGNFLISITLALPRLRFVDARKHLLLIVVITWNDTSQPTV